MPKFKIITSGSTFSVPNDWNNSNNVVHCIGAGANGSAGTGTGSGTIAAGGGGGAYARKANVALTAGGTASCQIGVVGGTVTVPGGTAHTWVTSNTTVRAAGTASQTGATTANSIGDQTYAGGSGAGSGSGGGGGAAGPSGAGATATTSTGGTGNNGTVPAATNGTFWTDTSTSAQAGAGGGGNAATSQGPGGAAGLYGGGGGGGRKSGNAGGAGRAGLIILEWTPAVALQTLGWTSGGSVPETAAPGILVGTITSTDPASSLALTDSAGGRFTLSLISGQSYGVYLAAGAGLDYETTTSYNIQVTETLSGASGSPKISTLTVTVLNVTEGTLTPVTRVYVTPDGYLVSEISGVRTFVEPGGMAVSTVVPTSAPQASPFGRAYIVG